jgi:glutaredoxin 3
MNKIKIYSTPTCHFCHMAKDFFKEKGIEFEDFDVSVDLEKRKEMLEKSGQMGVPVIILNDKDIIVGFNKPKIIEILGIKE